MTLIAKFMDVRTGVVSDHNVPDDAPVPDILTRAQIQAKRRDAYRIHADPLFFQAQRGGATEQEWLDAVALVKAQYPYPEGEA